MGEVIAFPVRSEPERLGVTDEEHARHLARLKLGYGEDESLEMLVTARRIRAGGHAD